MTDDVGYGRPPLETRYQKGRSGNPSGRPKKRPSTLAEDVVDVLALPVTARSGDKQVRLNTLEAMFQKLCMKALNGEKRALSAAFDMIDLKTAADAEPSNKQIDMGEVNAKLRNALGLPPADPDEPGLPAPPPPRSTPEELAAKEELDEAWANWERRQHGRQKSRRRRVFGE